jgi:putative hydrolase of the HAD superfamily
MARFTDRFEVILLDLMGTFMFGGDRFSEEEDYAATYRKLGGSTLSAEQIDAVITEVSRRMSVDYGNPDLYECFPPASDYVGRVLSENDLPEGELRLLENVFALHETGVIPQEHAAIIFQLSQTHRLGVVSNIWCRSQSFLEEFGRSGVRHLFEVAVFSSDHGINKPSPRLFGEALGQFGVDASRAVFVGDSLRHDVAGAKAAGLAAVWISGGSEGPDESSVRPDRVISHLRDLLTA